MTMRGTVSALSRKRSFLLIRPEGSEQQVFCHVSELQEPSDDLDRGVRVEFEVRRDDLQQAQNVRLLRPLV